MWFKHRAWIPFSSLLCLVNVVAVWFAARPGEPWHATIHALLAVLFGSGALYLQLRLSRMSAADANVVGRLQALETRLATPDQQELARALEAIAVEVERIGEGQRFLTKLLVERDPQLIARPGTSAAPDALPAPIPPGEHGR